MVNRPPASFHRIGRIPWVPAMDQAPLGGTVRPVKVLRAGVLYALLTVAFTWPLCVRLRVMDAGDSAFFAWVMAWEVHALTTDPARLPEAPIFHPLPHALGYDEPVLGTTLFTLPLWLFTDDAVLVLNLARLLTFLLSGLTAYLL